MKSLPEYHVPPERIMQFLRWFCDESFLEEIEGDLFELFQEEVDVYGIKKANWRFFWMSIGYINPYFFGKKTIAFNLQHKLTMFQHYFKIGLRYLWKERLYSFINIVGLSLGIACCLTVLFYIQDETGYDNYHPNADSIYRVSTKSITISNGEEREIAFTPILWGPALQKDYPEIEGFARFTKEVSDSRPWIVNNEEKSFFESDIFFADPSALQLFNWPLIEGDPKTALDNPGSIVITQEMASKYFGNDNALGQTLVIDPRTNNDGGDSTHQTYPVTVTGVLKNIPEKSHFTFDFLVPSIELNRIYRDDINGDGSNRRWLWRGLLASTYIKLKKGTDPKQFEQNFEPFLDKYLKDDTKSRGYFYDPFLQRLDKIYLEGSKLGEYQPVGNFNYVLFSAIIALFILFIACINFINLATARATNRAKEIGLRKTVGALRKEIIAQFLSETFAITFIALALSVIIARIFLPTFYYFLDKPIAISFHHLSNWLINLGIIAVLVTFLSGLYPAILVSRFNPVDVLKNSFFKASKGISLRKGLVVFQFFLSAMAIILTLTLYAQLKYMQNYELGFDKDKVLILPPETTRPIASNAEIVKKELLDILGVSKLSFSSWTPSFDYGGDYYGKSGGNADNAFVMGEIFADYDFLDLYQLEVVAGRNFLENLGQDKVQRNEDGRVVRMSALLNETAVKRFGWANPEDAIGQDVVRDPNAIDWTLQIVGVLKDFHFQNLREEIGPVAILLYPQYNYTSLKLSGGNIQDQIAAVEANLKSIKPDLPFDYQFLEANLKEQYEIETKLGKAFWYVSLFAIFIACLGLFGLAAFLTSKKIKEIGIRKTLGANSIDIIGLVLKEFVILIVLSVMIASPIAWYVGKLGLNFFAYQVPFSLTPYLFTLFASLSIAVITVGYHTLKAANKNPITSLKTE